MRNYSSLSDLDVVIMTKAHQLPMLQALYQECYGPLANLYQDLKAKKFPRRQALENLNRAEKALKRFYDVLKGRPQRVQVPRSKRS